MNALSPLKKNGEEMEDFATDANNEFFQYISDENNNSDDFFDAIDFHDLFDGDDGDEASVLPWLLEAVDREVAVELSTGGGGGYGLEGNNGVYDAKKLEEDKLSSCDEKKNTEGRREDGELMELGVNVGKDKDTKGKLRRKSTTLLQSKNPNGKRKQKVDWTPELHKKFVQAVEQLGLDKAVPSKILEIMKIDCLTRHNIASHLQKYRLHRKHMLAREVESAAWNRKRQIYGPEGGKRDGLNSPTMGFPPPSPTSIYPHFRPFHVWGHPTITHHAMYPWPRQPVQPPPPPSVPWTTALPCLNPQLPLRPNPFYWLPYHQQSFNIPLSVPGAPLHIINKVEHEDIIHSDSSALFDFNDSLNKDETIRDDFLKPRPPLPLGLKPPSLNSVLEELQRQGISTIPPIDP